MNSFSLKESSEIKDFLERINYGHDSSLKRIEFMKNREIDDVGNLVFPFMNIKDIIKCDIRIELLHNNFKGAKTEQLVIFNFKGVNSFIFNQNETFDYSDINEILYEKRIVFYATSKKIKVLELSFSEIVVFL